MNRQTVNGIACALAALVTACAFAEKYEAKWESLDRRPVPQWWTDAKFGIFIHWGPYAVPAFAPVPKDGKKLTVDARPFCGHHPHGFDYENRQTILDFLMAK